MLGLFQAKFEALFLIEFLLCVAIGLLVLSIIIIGLMSAPGEEPS